MSAVQCAKELLCDPDVSKQRAISNTLIFLQRQAESRYRGDPSDILKIKKDIQELLSPHLECGILEVVTYLESKDDDISIAKV